MTDRHRRLEELFGRALELEPGEMDAFVDRVSDGFERLLADYPGQSVLVVAHAGVIRAILATVLNMPPVAMYRIHVANAGLTRLRTDTLRRFNFEAHGRA